MRITLFWICMTVGIMLCLSGCQESRAHRDVRVIKAACPPMASNESIVYCSLCGMSPSPEGVKCPVTNASHNFRKTEAGKLLVCSLCGAAPSPEGTKCPVTNASHNFREY